MLENVLKSTRDHDRPEVILSAALYLLSAYGRTGGCPRLAHMVLRHLELIAEHGDVPPLLRSTCAQLVDQWEQVLQSALPGPSDDDSAAAAAAATPRLVH